jgi:hypothetical protein
MSTQWQNCLTMHLSKCIHLIKPMTVITSENKLDIPKRTLEKEYWRFLENYFSEKNIKTKENFRQ